MLYELVRPLLFSLDAENAHDATLASLHLAGRLLPAGEPLQARPVQVMVLTHLNAWASGPQTYTSPWKQFMVEADENGEREGYLWSDNKRFLFVLATVREIGR